MNLTEFLSRRIEGDAHKDEKGYKMDPMTVAIITSAVVQIITLLYECHKDQNLATKEVNNLSRFNKIRLRIMLRRKLGWIKYLREGHKYMRSFKDTGRDINPDMMGKLYKENIDAFDQGTIE